MSPTHSGGGIRDGNGMMRNRRKCSGGTCQHLQKPECSSPGYGGGGGGGAEGGRDIPRQQDKYEFYNGS